MLPNLASGSNVSFQSKPNGHKNSKHTRWVIAPIAAHGHNKPRGWTPLNANHLQNWDLDSVRRMIAALTWIFIGPSIDIILVPFCHSSRGVPANYVCSVPFLVWSYLRQTHVGKSFKHQRALLAVMSILLTFINSASSQSGYTHSISQKKYDILGSFDYRLHFQCYTEFFSGFPVPFLWCYK